MKSILNFSFKIFNKRFISPWYIKPWGDPGSYYSNDMDYPVLLKVGKFVIKIPKVSRMGGSHDSTTYAIRFFKYRFDKDNGKFIPIFSKEISFTWRLDTAWENFDKEGYYKHKREKYEKRKVAQEKLKNHYL